jgi:pimeloyl-ACP methyl ester carboxylesterase
MSRIHIQAMTAVLALSLALGVLPAASQTIAAAEKPRKASSSARSGGGHVYLLRGLLNVFSLGMDDLAAKLQARGVAATVHNHADWQGIADDIAVKYKAGKHGPVILIGHSLGADAVMVMAEYLGKKGVPVALVVPFDGTGSYAASSNVSRVMNLTQRDYAYMRKGAGFRGTLQNIDVSKDSSIDHITIDKSDRLHKMVVGSVLGILGRGGAPKTAGSHAKPSDSSSSTSSTAASAAAASASSASPAPAAAPKAQ